jgi:hypothetical protein
MYKPFRIVIPNPSHLSLRAKRSNLTFLLRINSVRNLVLSERDCHVAPLLAMTTLKESLNLGKKIVNGGTMNKATTKIVGAFLIGGLIGASVALLYAPKSGRETREDISKAARRIKNKSVDLAGEMIESVNDLTNNVKDNINREKSRISLVRLLFP